MNKNYELIEKRYVNDVEGDVYHFKHIKTGAHVIKVACSDKNKTFCIAFRTEAQDDSGTPHIMEHSVLNGSKKYPIKSPFDQLIKGSLQTYLNAMTGNDMTMYPVASVSEKDYFNLMDVYLDAVFNPLIYSDNRILKQEGWRIVLNNPDDQLKYNGVVYNEMKGVYSDPLSVLATLITKNLFPDNGYGKAYGGDPVSIPNLTQEKFLEFHKKYYNPENSYIFFYGDADVEKELKVLDEGYLSYFEPLNANYEIPLQKPFSEMKKVSDFYPSDEDSDPENDTYFTLSFVTCDNTNTLECQAINVLGDILIGLESGILRQAFMQSGLGSEIDWSFECIQQSVFSILGHNCNYKDAEKFKDLILDTLKKIAEEGLDKETVNSVINRREFYVREGNDAQLGMKKLYEILSPWMFGGNPIDAMETVKNFEIFKKEVENGLLEKIIKKYFIDNNFSLLITFAPKQGLESEIEAGIQKKLDEYKATLSEKEINDLIEENRILDEIQNTPDTPEQLKCIPTLSKSDLNPVAEDLKAEFRYIDDTKVAVYEGFTNEILYMRIAFNFRVLPLELLPYGALLCEFLGLTSTEKYSFGKLDNMLKTYTGGLAPCTSVYSKVIDNKRVAFPELRFKGKALRANISKMFDILDQIINHPILDDKQRIKELTSRLATQHSNDINSKGYSIVRSRVDSYLDEAAIIEELLDGVDFYFFVKDLNEHIDEKIDEIISNLKKTLNLLVRQDNVTFCVSCQKEDYELFEQECRKIRNAFNSEKSTILDWDLKTESKLEAFVGQSKVQYVMKACDLLEPGFEWKGQTCVLSKILSSDYLQTNVRVRGGAYGGWSYFGYDGLVCFSSYRDPNIKETLDVFDNTIEYLENFNEDDDTMLKYIIGTISSKDQPLTAAQKGQVAINRLIMGRTFDEIQRERDQILNTTAADIRAYADMMRKFKEKSVYCVYGGEEKINENAKLFKNIVKL